MVSKLSRRVHAAIPRVDAGAKLATNGIFHDS